jgi:hypothetical protein
LAAPPDIFDEIEEDLKRERFAKLWARHGWVAIVLVLALVAGTAGWQAWQWRERGNAEAATAKLLAAGRAQDQAAALTALQAAQQGSANLATLARLAEAARHAQGNDLPAALRLWEALAADTRTDALYRDLASLLVAANTLDAAEPAALTARLAPLAQPANPWRHAAQELQALLAARQGNTEAAIAAFRALASDVTAPGGVRDRARIMLGTLGATGAAG